jgi:16S rRNA (cytosine1402-N4)-methyltransferase
LPTAPFHTPVLLHEALSFLAPGPEQIIVDCTLGGGGHSAAILERLGSRGRCIGLDADDEALAAASERLKNFGPRFTAVRENFANLRSVLSELGIMTIDGILFDLGVSSHQLDDGSRGFTFRTDDALDMRMDRRQPLTAALVVNTYGQAELESILRNYGEERMARKIAGRIASRRQKQPFRSTAELAAIVKEAVGARFAVKSLARVFQAIRIEVNAELDRLRQGLERGVEALKPGGRLVVISYHSLEDRIVKECMQEMSRTVIRSGIKLVPDKEVQPRLKILAKRPVEPSPSEVSTNPRSRSAKLRAAEKV